MDTLIRVLHNFAVYAETGEREAMADARKGIRILLDDPKYMGAAVILWKEWGNLLRNDDHIGQGDD